jgi:hypothetical protein
MNRPVAEVKEVLGCQPRAEGLVDPDDGCLRRMPCLSNH